MKIKKIENKIDQIQNKISKQTEKLCILSDKNEEIIKKLKSNPLFKKYLINCEKIEKLNEQIKYNYIDNEQERRKLIWIKSKDEMERNI
tara:strand:+ start:80 stop:346 length:267 start_codon:yes stop_codon:yes gene_type:complete